MDENTSPISTLAAAAVAASIAEGKQFLTDATRAGWSRVRGLLAAWAGPSLTRIDRLIDDIKDAPEDKVQEEAQRLPGRLSEVKTPVPDELVAAARDLIAELKKDPRTAFTCTKVSQAMSNISHSDGVVQASGGSHVSVNVQKKNALISLDQSTIGQLTLVAGFGSPQFKAPPERELLAMYLRAVFLRTRRVDLAGIDPGAIEGPDAQPDLGAIYVGMNTTAPRMRKDDPAGTGERSRHAAPTQTGEADRNAPVSALEFVDAQKYAVLLGDPGGGKSTFAQMLAYSMAAELLGVEQAGLKRLGDDWTLGPLVPVLVVVRDFAAASALYEEKDPFERLWRFIEQSIPASYRAEFAPRLRLHLFDKGGVFIFDGYDEAPIGEKHASTAEQHRARVQGSVLALRESLPKCRILLTSRVYAYQRIEQRDWRLEGFREATLGVFTAEQQQAFIDGWYADCARKHPTMTESQARARAADFKAALEHRPDLRPLAERPLLLTLMASLHAWRGGELPADREGLYDKSVELLMHFWEKRKKPDDEKGKPMPIDAPAAAFLATTPAKVSATLEQLAFDVHKGQAKLEGAADIPENDLVGALLRVAEKAISPALIIDYIVDRAGLLHHRGGGIYAFPHRTFQEYMAARHLTSDPTDLPALIAADPGRWREAFLLVGARTARTPYAVWNLIRNVLDEVENPGVDTYWLVAALSAQLMCEAKLLTQEAKVLTEDAKLKPPERKILAEVRSRLVRMLEGGRLPTRERAAAGRWLGLVGDPRKGVGVRPDGVPDIDWITVPPPGSGVFVMGEKGGSYYGTVRVTCDRVRAPFQLAKYPVTVSQFRAFARATGYSMEDLPGEFDLPTQPRVGVSWHDAMAFCAWLGKQIDKNVTLPTEAQWEYAARGEDGRAYPWGEEWRDDAANTSEADLSCTSVVGAFPKGASWCGAMDLSGNVEEWCRTKWSESHAKYDADLEAIDGDDRDGASRVVRGGSWVDVQEFARCAGRLRGDPGGRDDYIGFRVCVSPFSTSDL